MGNGNQPASPSGIEQTPHLRGETPLHTGLTKREHFAGLAMQGILSNSCYEAPRKTKVAGMAKDAVLAADALLKELNNA